MRREEDESRKRRSPDGRYPDQRPIVVFEAFDIVFFEVVPVLDFDDLEELLSGVFEAVFDVAGNKGALVCMNQIDLISPWSPWPFLIQQPSAHSSGDGAGGSALPRV